jgi:hypothetical protein
MVCFRYIIVNILHKGEDKDGYDDDDDDGNNNNNNNNNNNTLLHIKSLFPVGMLTIG